MKKPVGLVVMGVIFGLLLAACAPAAAPTSTPVKAPAATPASVAPAAIPTPTVPAATPAPTKPAATPTVAPAAASPVPTKPAATPTSAPPAATPVPTKPAAAAGDPVAGKAVFDANCTPCHPGGQQGVGPSLVGAVGRLGEAGVRNQVRNGKNVMPPFPDTRINDNQLADLIAYVATLK
ncbi:MAG: c-type cytochrome [Dehalococcoidia bacterium]|nr:c-type cytochrome [Dehalococcoidia bacterium]